jgi:hypothetical protein
VTRRRTPSPDPDLLYIADDLRPLAVPVADLTIHPDNARRHSERDIPVLAESLRRYGQRKPIVGKREYRGLSNVIVAGNGTLEAARDRLHWTHIAVTWFDGEDDVADEFALVDNRTAELSEWDLATLSRQLKALKERGGDALIQQIGWAAHEAAPLLAADWEPSPVGHLPGREVSYRSVTLSLGQWMILELAIQRLQSREHDASLPEGRCLELLAAEYLGGVEEP